MQMRSRLTKTESSLVPILEFDDGFVEDIPSDIKCSYPHIEHLEVNLTIIHQKMGPLTQCRKLNKSSPNITCEAEFTEEDHKTEMVCEARIVVKSKPGVVNILSGPKITNCSSNVIWVEGQEVAFHCKAVGYPVPVVTCKKNNTIYKEEDKFIASKNMSGVYTCMALSKDKDLKKVTVAVHYKPKILSSEVMPAFIVNKGDNFTLACEAESMPPPTYMWEGPTPDLALSTDNRTITIHGMEPKHNGIYTCKAKNMYGEDSKRHNITVKDKPKILKFEVLPTRVLKRGDTITLTCEAEGIPSPTYSWVTPTPEVQFSSDKHIMTIQWANQEHMGNYTCKAHNEYGVDIKTQNITITEQPKIINIEATYKTPLEKGKPVILICEAEGIPTPTYSWETPISEAHFFQFSKDNRTIVILSMESRHVGNYTCKAKNPYGVDTMTHTITDYNRGKAIEPAFVTIIFTLISSSLIFCLH
ncbi:neural cell adhesion molecule 1-like isoform 2-T2 [Discoglossus pictus]